MSRYTDYKYAKNILKNIEDKPEKYLIIHYSCESFENLGGKSSKICSISVRKFNNAQTTNFSIHKYAEILNLDISENTYQQIEEVLLKDFYNYVDKNSDKTWIHYNMRDNTFGFSALEDRFRILKGSPIKIEDSKKLDLGHLFKLYYGEGYIENPHIEKLITLNDLHPTKFFNGQDEAKAFTEGKYSELSHSTASKVNLFSTFIKEAIDNTLETNIPKWKMRGTNISGLYSTFEETRLGKICIGLVLMIIGGIIGALISKMI